MPRDDILCCRVNVVFIDPEGNETPVEAREGQHVLEVAHKNNIELEGMLDFWKQRC